MSTISLNGMWEITDEPIDLDITNADAVLAKSDWISSPVPGDIHQGLISAGKITEPLTGVQSRECAWTEERSWWYKRTFDAPNGYADADAVELSMNGLDSNAVIFLNGVIIGRHVNAFRPFVCDVKPVLKPAGNVLLVRLSAGVENITEDDMIGMAIRAGTEAGNGRPERGDARRPFVRKPQYSFGWDWSPRLATTAIAGDVTLQVLKSAALRDIHVRSQRHGDDISVIVDVAVEGMHFYRTLDAELSLFIRGEKSDVKAEKISMKRAVLVHSGNTVITFDVPLKRPKLWWPNGMGEQHLYTVEAALLIGGKKHERMEKCFGVRSIKLLDVNTFAFEVNGVKMFCKGANWIPADAIYARVSDERYHTLVREAAEANFTMLRIWGGGLYEREAFYDECDRAGILVWHDFMFACAPYPDHLEWFRREVELEAKYQIERLRHHPCMAVWSGNNENNWGFCDWWKDRTQSGAYIYNHILPDAVRAYSPDIPYWNGSPYGGADSPNSPSIGDRHHWGDCMMNKDMMKRITPEEYDACTSPFVSEYGYIGACSKRSTEDYLDTNDIDITGDVWKHHTNTFEKDTVLAGIQKHYRDTDGMPLVDYFLYSGLCQGLMYSYSLEAMRFRGNCHGALFWMYEDCWGELGWTIIDYYLRRKISYYFVKRALAHRRLILREEKRVITVVMANDTLEPVKGYIEFGYTTLDGKSISARSKIFIAKASSRTVIASFKRGKEDPKDGVWFARIRGKSEILPATLRAADIREMKLTKPELSVKTVKTAKGIYAVTVTSDVFAHAVHLELPDSAVPDDDYFDLLPGASRTVAVRAKTLAAKDVVVTSAAIR
ncbi:MAG: glycoside hydrolase family 2 protein [Spirochaetota bacterium]